MKSQVLVNSRTCGCLSLAFRNELAVLLPPRKRKHTPDRYCNGRVYVFFYEEVVIRHILKIKATNENLSMNDKSIEHLSGTADSLLKKMQISEQNPD